MATYLLLRDNKQNGPYTFDEIKAKGLKAYDLVWVEGKSAAWRYPGEVEELKPFSPAVVEQPYDRFFKTPSQENKPAEQIKQPQVSEKEIINPTYQQASLQVGKRNIYVTLPSAKNNFVNKEIFTEKEPVKKEPVVAEANTRDYTRPIASQTALVAEEELYTQPVQQSIKKNNEKIIAAKKITLPAGFKNIFLLSVVVIALISGGIFIGLSINKNSSSLLAKNNNTVTEQQPGNNQTNAIPVSVPVTDQKQTEVVTDNTKNIQPENVPAEKKSAGIVDKKKINASKEKTETAQNVVPAGTSNDDTNKNASIIPVTHREATHRTDAAPDKDALKNTLVNMVSISANKYNVGTFGGISDLQLTVSNHSVHQLDLVIVEVQYLQANKKVFKTENIYFHNINAGEAMMLEAPKSPRGVKIQSKITVINTKEPGLSYSGS
jgi:hypothetical protein